LLNATVKANATSRPAIPAARKSRSPYQISHQPKAMAMTHCAVSHTAEAQAQIVTPA
jgi:hypothetical protein